LFKGVNRVLFVLYFVHFLCDWLKIVITATICVMTERFMHFCTVKKIYFTLKYEVNFCLCLSYLLSSWSENACEWSVYDAVERVCEC